MKSSYGLIIAAGLGIVGIAFNFAYLQQHSQKTVDFVGLNKDLALGERLSRDHFVKVAVPEENAGNLKDYAVLWSAADTVVNERVCREIVKGEGNVSGPPLLMLQDLRTPPQEIELGEGESAIWIPIDPKTCVPSSITPGDMVTFKVPRPQLPTPAGARGKAPPPAAKAADGGEDPPPAAASGSTEPIGPFKVLAVGNRLSSARVWQGAKMPQIQENVLMIRKSTRVAGEVEKADRLWECLQASNFRQMGVELNTREKTKK